MHGDVNDWGMVSELRCTKHNNADEIARRRDSTQTIWGEEEGKGNAQRLVVVARQAFASGRVIIVVHVRPHRSRYLRRPQIYIGIRFYCHISSTVLLRAVIK